MITRILNCMNCSRTLKIHQDGAAPGLNHPTSTTGGQRRIARCTRGYKRPTTEYNNKLSQTTLKVMQWNAEGLMRKKTELEHRMNNENIDTCSFKVRGYQCFRTDRGGDRRKGVQKDTACTRLDCCRHLHKLCLYNTLPQRWGPDSVF